MRGEPLDPRVREQWRAARRSVAREHHPDVGGDLAVYLARMREIDQRFLSSPDELDRAAIRIKASAALRRGSRKVTRGARRVRGVLPRRVPGARRYIEL